MTDAPAIDVDGVGYSYGNRAALTGINLEIRGGEIFALLGPNGSGKTTLFRLLSTLLPLQAGQASIFGEDLRSAQRTIRCLIGVVFQAPSLDKKLTVVENLRQQAALYGVAGGELKRRQIELLEQLGLTDRAHDYCESLSGGLRRRVDLAKGMLHRPRLLLMDEPSTGLDPAARSDLWRYLCRLRDEFHVTVVLTTHLLEEADRADRIAILNAGELVAIGHPSRLRESLGGNSITIETDDPHSLAAAITAELHRPARILDGQVRLDQGEEHQLVSRLIDIFPDQIRSIKLGKPTLEDVFIDKTGHRFWRETA